MGGTKDEETGDLCKKPKIMRSVWRPVSTDSACCEGSSLKKEKIQISMLTEDALYQDQTVQQRYGLQEIPSTESTPAESELLCLDIDSSQRKENDTADALEKKTFEHSKNVIDEKLSQSQRNGSVSQGCEIVRGKEDKDDNIIKMDLKVNAYMTNIDRNHSQSIEVDAALIRFIKGKGGSTQERIEHDTGVKIIFPSSKEKTSIVIEATSAENIAKASEKIQIILAEAIKSPSLDYSHFISLPLAIHLDLVEKLTDFQNSILGNPDSSPEIKLDTDSNENKSEDGEDKIHKDSQSISGEHSTNHLETRANNVKVKVANVVRMYYPPKAQRLSDFSDLHIDQSIFIKPKTFHLTVLMLKLWNKERVTAATEVLERISSSVNDALGGRPVSIRLKGLNCMKGSPAKARVLYAPVEEIGGEDRLLRACQVIIDAYVEAGLVLETDREQKLKLHATIMNARHRKRKFKTRRDDSFDARTIFKQYGSYEWGDYLIREAHLSQRFLFDESGYYHCCASIPFPENMQID